MKHREYPVIEGRVDWLTGTCLHHKLKTPTAMESMESEAMRMFEQLRLSGNIVKRARLLGFEGLMCNGAFYGRSKIGVMVRLSGNVALFEWDSFYPYLSNVTRVDCAATIQLDHDEARLSTYHHRQALKYKNKTAPKFKVVHLDGGTDGRTLNLGSRQSEGYGRIYDKFRESGDPQFRNCWRYEVEFKGRAATDVAFRLYQEPTDLGVPVRIVADWFQQRMVRPAFSAQAITRYRVGRQVTDVERRLTWLYTQVGPAVRELIDLGYERQVHRALFGDNRAKLNSRDAEVRYDFEKIANRR